MENEKEQMIVKSGEWSMKEAEKLMAEYKSCKTEHAKARIISKMINIMNRVSFEMNEIEKLSLSNEN